MTKKHLVGIFLCSILMLTPTALFPQVPQKDETTKIYEIYEQQLRAILESRGVVGGDIRKMLISFKTSGLSSDKNFANLLNKLYPSDQGIGVLFYFFNADSLRRVFFEPGKVIEIKTVHITRTELLQLSVDFNFVLDLEKKSANRTPVRRGFTVVKKPPTSGITYASLIKKATQLLLPELFDNQYKHLLIIPALNIGTIPFYLLEPYKDGSSLVDNCSYTVIPGLLDLLTLRTKVLKEATTLWQGEITNEFRKTIGLEFNGYSTFNLDNPLFIADPMYPTTTDFYFPDLPGAKKEIDSVLKYAKTYKLLQGPEAVKDSVIEYMKYADMVYFATHGMADDEKPMEKSFLVLSGNDPFLTAKNIMELKDSHSFPNGFPEMVILSACQTGLGKSMEAGIAGLARSFLLGGSSNVIMSLWNVDDEATAYLMTRFIFHLQEPHLFMPSEPLRLAILDTKKIYSHPIQWAGFSLFGIDL